MTTPNSADQFSRYMAELFDERNVIGVSTGFQAFFGNPMAGAVTHFSPDANVVDIDIIRGNEKIAALIPRGTVSRPLGGTQKDMQTENYTSFSRKYPLAEEEGNITADQILNRLGGENPYQTRSRLDRMRKLGLNYHMESVRRIVRMQEVLAASSVLDGVMPAILGTTNADLIYDFRRPATHIDTVSTGWNQASPDILGDIDAACDLCRADGKVMPDFIGMGGQAMDAFIKDTTVSTLADNRRFELIEVSTNNPVPQRFMRFVDSGWIARGRLRTPQGYDLWIFSDIDVYTDDAGDTVKYMPEDKAFITSVTARCDRYFGPPETLPMIPQRASMYQEMFGFNPGAAPMPMSIKGDGNIIMPAMFYADAYVSADWKKVTIRTQGAPIFATTQTDAFVTLDGLIT